MSSGEKMDVSQELLYHVDEKDQVLGACKRGEAHRLELRHRAVHVIVKNASGEVFVQKRSAQKDCNPGLWDTSAAGHVDFGETYDATAVRELAEELCIFVGNVPPALFKLPAQKETGWEFIHVYSIVYDDPVTANPDEISESRWVKPGELDRWIDSESGVFTDSFRLIWKKARTLTGQERF